MAILPTKTYKENELTVVIATYKRTDLAVELAKKIHKKKPQLEIIIVDQENPEVKELNLPRDIVYMNLDEAGLPNARNMGIKKASGDIILFLDDDSEPGEKCIESHLKAYSDSDVVGVAGRVINDGEKIPVETNVETGKINGLGTKFTAQFWGTLSQDADYVYGCNMSFRKDALLKIGGFDTRFIPPVSAFEEIDASLQIRKYGKILFVPDALVYHHKAPSGGTRVVSQNKMNVYYQCYGFFLRKNITFPLSLVSLLIRTITVLRESPFALLYFYKGFLIL